MSEGLDGDEGWSDYEEEDDEGYSGGSATIGGDSSYQSSVLEDNSLKGTVISQENGQMQISRRSRDEEIPMGDGDWTIFVYLCGSDLESDGGWYVQGLRLLRGNAGSRSKECLSV